MSRVGGRRLNGFENFSKCVNKMTEPTSFCLEHVRVAGALIVAASRAGAFKLPNYMQAFQAYKTCGEISEAGKQDGFDLETAPKPSLVLVHNVLEFASNSNAFVIDDYATVVKVLVAFRTYLKIQEKEEEDEEKKA